MKKPAFQPGDRVRHTAKPEWGVGSVLRAESVQHEGELCQKLVLSFPHHGRITLHTGYADLVPTQNAMESAKENPLTMTTTRNETDFKTALTQLPEAATDVLSSPDSQLAATLQLYRYSTEPRSLLDWAVVQTGADDPLSHMTRHELEQAFENFAINRDRHLRKLIEAMRKEGNQNKLHETLHQLPSEARRTVANALKGH